MFLGYLRNLIKDPYKILKVKPKKTFIIILTILKIRHLDLKITNLIINFSLLVLYPLKNKQFKKNEVLFVGNLYFSSNKLCMSSDYYGPLLSLEKENIKFDTYIFSNNFLKKLIIFWKIPFLGYKKIILSSNTPDNPIYFSYFQLKILKKLYKIELINILWDTCSKNFATKRKDLLICDKNIVGDHDFKKRFDYKKNNIFQRVFWFDEKKLMSLANNYDLKKNIDTIFIGQTSNYRDYRSKTLRYLKENTDIFTSEKIREEFLPDSEYFNLMSRAKICINFSMSVDYHQIKGRCYESFIFKTLVLEDERSPLLEYFSPNEDLVTYKDKYDLLEKINFYLNNEDERIRITENAKKKYTINFSSYNYWKNIL